MDTILQVKELCYSYPDGDSRRIIYDHADVSFEKGKFYALTDDSGSGKTTISKMNSDKRNRTQCIIM